MRSLQLPHPSWHTLAALLLVAVASARIASTYKVFNFTIDEPAHAAAGAEWLAGHYRYDVHHPPLSRAVAALGLRSGGRKYDGNPNMWYEGFGILGGGVQDERGLVFGRAAVLPFFWIACAVVFFWTLRLAGPFAAVLALALFTLLPPVLAHAGLITTDMALTAFTGAAFLASLRWAEKPTRARALVLGAVTGLAVLSKFSAIPFLVCAWALAYLATFPRKLPVPQIRSAPLALAAAALTVWAGYHFSFGAAPPLPFPIPAPELIAGIQAVAKHNAEGHQSYLLGLKNMTGFWDYYLVALAVKTPLAILALFAWTFAAAFRKLLPIRTPLLFSLGILLFSMAFSSINIGIRHVLPVYVGLTIAAGVASAALWRSRPVAVSLLFALAALSGAVRHPDYLSYTNELLWNRPERVLVDSDVDWGQDMKRLETRMRQLGVSTLHFEPFNRGYLLTHPRFPKLLPIPSGGAPPPGWTAVSVTAWKLGGGPAWLDRTPPAETIGNSILLFRNP